LLRGDLDQAAAGISLRRGAEVQAEVATRSA
jgi:hypothetical protein